MAKDKKVTTTVEEVHSFMGLTVPTSKFFNPAGFNQILSVSSAEGEKNVMVNDKLYTYELDAEGNPTTRIQKEFDMLPNGSYGWKISRQTPLSPLTIQLPNGTEQTVAYGFRWDKHLYENNKIMGDEMTSTWEFPKEVAEFFANIYKQKKLNPQLNDGTPTVALEIDELHQNSKAAATVGFVICRVGKDINKVTGSGEIRKANLQARRNSAVANTTASITEQFETIQSRKNAKAYKDLETETDFG